MKKQNFIEGTMIGTIATIICKVLGLVYVIPFKAIVGSQGGALYGYGYNIYTVFLSLATSGIPIAMSKIISEYNTLEYDYAKNRAYHLGSRLIVGLGFISFLVLFIFAPTVAQLIIGDITGGNTIEGVTLVIRIVSTALLIVPLLAVKKGYLQGHKYMVVPQLSNVIEQIVRVIIIIFGSYITYKVLNKSLELSVGVAMSGATVGAISSYLYLNYKMKKGRNDFNMDAKMTIKEKYLTDKVILKKIILYAIPFILIDLIKSAYNTVDMFTVVRTLSKLGFEGSVAEEVLADMTTWGAKLNMIVTSLVVGLSAALVPNLMSSFVKHDYTDVNKKINQSLQILTISAIPMALGLSFLAYPVWTMFYGQDTLGASIFQFHIFTAMTLTFHSVLIDATQTINDSKMSIGMLMSSFIFKCIINIPMMYLFSSLGLKPYYGAITATMLSQGGVVTVLLMNLKHKLGCNYKMALKTAIKTIISCAIMMMVLFVIKIFVPLTGLSRMTSVLVCIFYAVIGITIYMISMIKMHAFEEILSETMINKILVKLHIKKI